MSSQQTPPPPAAERLKAGEYIGLLGDTASGFFFRRSTFFSPTIT
jgi:hypothetical protein